MKSKHPSEKLLSVRKLFLFAGFCAVTRSENIFANPTGLSVSSGSATLQQIGSQLNITTSQTAYLNWSSFNIQPGETTTFIQPSVNSIAINLIGGKSPSQIFGNLNANGTVILANANGLYFGPNSMVKIGGSFIATTAPLAPDFGANTAWTFTGMPPTANIVNYGQIQAGHGRSLFFIAEQIDNHGSLNAPGGDIGLYAGQSVLVSERPDGRGLSATVKMPAGSVNNSGEITADAGTIALSAQVVNQDGIIQADSFKNQNGVVELVASDTLNLGSDSQILARGDNSTPGSSGGTITLRSGNNFSDASGSQISAAGGAQGGNGGNIEVSAPNILSLNSTLDATAQAGWAGGTFNLDPVNILLGTSTANGAINVNTAFAGFSQILLQASGNITLNSGTTWNLSGSTGGSSGQLTLQAGGDITFGNNSKITDANSWSVTLQAGYNAVNNTITAGSGNIYLNGGSGLNQSGTIQLAAGSANLYAGQSILVGSGSVFTTGGGSIYASALAGDINAGTANGSSTSGGQQSSDYIFTSSGSRPNAILGGIATAAGGNVTLIAGNNITSVPTVPNNSQWPGASGTYGAGNVTVIAGNQISGNYTLANGVGTLLAGVSASAAQAANLQNPNSPNYAATLSGLATAVTQTQNPNGNIGGASGPNGPVTLSLIQGSWNAWAANNIYLKEVNNPNGTFNSLQSFQFNYAPDAAANFWAGNAITLTGANLTRVSRQNQTMPPIYAPILSLNAGAGGITVNNSIVLYPSSVGSLQITTRNGGNLSGAVTANSTLLNGITMSDSGSVSWTTFANGHAATPLHLNDPNPVRLNISGSIKSFALTVPTFAEITVGGDTYNFGFIGQNLSAVQTTFINVAGSIMYRGDLTSEILSGAIASSSFDAIVSGDPTLAGALRYDAGSKTISFVGVMGSATEQSLLNPVDANGNAVFTGAQLTAWRATVTQLFADSQSASLGDNGLALSGPGNFNLSANTIDLGISGGISVLAPDAALAAISPYGANLNVTTIGNLEMTSTKIANESYLGGIHLQVGDTLDVGGQFTAFGDPDAAKGIFTTSGGNVNVNVHNDVNIDSSRIAAYNGGNLTIESQNGDVNAGDGGSGYVNMNSLALNPATHQLTSLPATIPGSGILATTVPGGSATLGNILVETPNGNISANAGGILQIPFNGHDKSHAIAEMLAGYELRDANGVPVLASDLANGTPVFVSPARNIDAGESGVIAQNLVIKATGYIKGLFIGSQTVVITAGSSGPNTGPGPLIIGPTIVSDIPQDGGPDPILINSSHSDAAPPVTVAQAEAPVADTAATVASKTENQEDDLLGGGSNKKGQGITLAQKVSRVTVLLPAKD